MDMIVIYDNTGKIYFCAGGDVQEPAGLPFLYVTIPTGKILKSIDVSGDIPQPIFADIPKSELEEEIITIKSALFKTIDIDNCTLDELKSYYIKKNKSNLEEYLCNNPIQSDCHDGIQGTYSITYDKQQLLAQMILVKMMAENNNIPYQASWNQTGQACTYDWTLSELQQLAFEIEEFVRPLISKQQETEYNINNCTNKEEVLDIDITFGNE